MSQKTKTVFGRLLDRTGERSVSEIHALTGPTVAWFVVFLIIPLFVIVYYSFLTYVSFSVAHEFTLTAWETVLFSGTIQQTFVRTIAVGLLVTALTLVLAYPVAYFLRFHTTPLFGIVLLLLLVIPFWTSDLIRTIGWYPILGREGVINQFLLWTGVIDAPLRWLIFTVFSQVVGYIQNYLVFMAAPIYISLAQIDEDLLDASETLRGDPIETFRNVTWPLSLPGVAIGCMFTFVLSIGNFTIPRFLSAGDVTISILIYGEVQRGLQYPNASALSITLLVVIFVFVFALFRLVDISDIAQG